MFEIKCREGIAKTGIWYSDGHKVIVPNVLFITTERFKPPEFAEILISSECQNMNKLCILDGGSIFYPKHDKNKNVISPTVPYPVSERKYGLFFDESRDLQVNETLYVLKNAIELIGHPKKFLEELVSIKKRIGYQKLVYAPGIATPSTMALLVYCGIDIFDTLQLIINARLGYFLLPTGKLHIADAKEAFCMCPSCISSDNIDFNTILGHNYNMIMTELNLIRNAIRLKKLRELVECRVRADVRAVSILRCADLHYYDFYEQYFPVRDKNIVYIVSKESMERPEIVRFRNRLKNRYEKPSCTQILLLLPCSAKKPYSSSKTHKLFRDVIFGLKNPYIIHEVIITSPLGIVPRELENVYPAAHYDIPVTGDWDNDEIKLIQELVTFFLEKNKYDHIISALPDTMDFIEIPDCVKTYDSSMTSRKSLTSLKNALKITTEYENVSKRDRLIDDAKSLARYQFGYDELLYDSIIRNRKIIRNNKHICTLSDGIIKLTLEGGKLLAQKNIYHVTIENFKLTGDVLSPGVVDADSRIRIGDEVVVIQNEQVIGIGTAMMSYTEMVEKSRGIAVKVRCRRHGLSE